MYSIAFFDIDNTIINGSTGLFLLSQMWKDKEISPPDFQKAVYCAFLYKLGMLPYEHAIKWIYEVCGKVNLDKLMKSTDAVYKERILPNIYKQAAEVIEYYRSKGIFVCLATASADYIADKIKVQVKANHVICNKSTVRENHLTHELAEPICYGVGKKILANQLAYEMGSDLTDCIFYSDSVTDLPLLAAVGKPIIVNPRRTDSWYKKLKNYEVVYWKM